jgi:pSer/pThr/pTyr-binding forkhead associated (FHA) protein
VTRTEDHEPVHIAKLIWADPQTAETHEYVLLEGAIATIGQSDANDICIRQRQVARRHAIITYRDGAFVLMDLGSADGTFVNEQRLHGATRLNTGDTIRLSGPLLLFSSTVSDADRRRAEESGKLLNPPPASRGAALVITNGPHEGESINLLLDRVTLGRATSDAGWEICLQDPTVSRPHARLERDGDSWTVRDLGSSNGTQLNGIALTDGPRPLRDGDVLGIGNTVALFRAT